MHDMVNPNEWWADEKPGNHVTQRNLLTARFDNGSAADFDDNVNKFTIDSTRLLAG